MPSPDLCVREVKGRYPHRGILRSENIVTSVEEVARIFRIRIDDNFHPDAWLEITVEVAATEVPCEEARVSA